MGKDNPNKAVGTPKWIDNRMKSKGLNKLRWYCQMCAKTCRDQNGFKCHIMSEAHIRQLQMFNENPAAFVDKYSQDFLEGNNIKISTCQLVSALFAQLPKTQDCVLLRLDRRWYVH